MALPKRRLYLINPRFQLNFILITTGFSITVLTVVYISIMRFFEHYLTSGKILRSPNSHLFFEFIYSQKHFMNQLFLVTSIFLIIFEIIFGLFYSHRICGPLQKMKNYLDSQDPNQPPNKLNEPLVFRETDYFKELADSLNQYMGRRH